MKTELTKEIEKRLFRDFEKLGQSLVIECQIGFFGGERDRVDAISYNSSKKEITCFEIKVSVADFHSKAKVSFVGNRNYYVLTEEVYEKVKDEIPHDIGVYVYKPKHLEKVIWCSEEDKYIQIGDYLTLVKSCHKRDCHYDKEVLLACMVRSRVNKTNLEIMKGVLL